MPCPYATTGSVFYYGQFNGHDIISEIKPLLTALVQADFRISNAIIQEALRLAGEDN
ncbi:DUF3368 domain-containing protein [Microseira wollei]|nr:DUF3368 domain-containing protein [Microseira wollei]